MVQQFEPLRIFTPVTDFGHAGVSFFFILSGFLLAWSYRDGITRREFYWRRFARIWPLHALTTAFAAAIAIGASASLAWPALPLILTFVHGWVPLREIHYGFNAPSWSLSAEALFYCLFPALFAVLCRRRRLLLVTSVVLLLMIVVALAVTSVMPRFWVNYLLYVLPAYRLGEFVIGICLAVAMRRGWRPLFGLRWAVWTVGFLFAVLMVCTLVVLGRPTALPSYVAGLWMIPGFVAVIVAVAAGDLRGDLGILRSKLLVKLGKWSFALYLIHALVVKVMDPVTEGLTLWMALAVGLLAIIVSIALSGVLYEVVERPAERRLRSMSPRPNAAHVVDG